MILANLDGGLVGGFVVFVGEITLPNLSFLFRILSSSSCLAKLDDKT